jgi:hypothetical protein
MTKSYRIIIAYEFQAWWWLTLTIPATWKVEIRRIMVCGQPGQNLVRPHLNKKSSLVAQVYGSRYVEGVIGGSG